MREDFPMEDNPTNPKNVIYAPSKTSTLILPSHPYSEVSLLSPLRTWTSRASTPSFKMTLWLSPSSLQISWCPGSSMTRAVSLISCIGKPSETRGLIRHCLPSHRSIPRLYRQESRDQRLHGLDDHLRLGQSLQELHHQISTS